MSAAPDPTTDSPGPTLPISIPGNPAEEVMGGLLIEIFVACILYGVTTLQVFIYSQKYPNDGPVLKFLVATVWILETVHTAFCMQFVYAYLITGFAHFENFLDINWGVGVTVICSVLIALCVQGYYTWRVWIVSNKAVVWTGIITLFALLRVGFGIASATLLYVYPNWLQVRGTHSSLVTVSGGLGSAALVDLLVAVTLSFYLKHNRATIHKPSNSMINKILLYTVNTGAITGTASLTCVILFATKKTSLVFLGLVEIQTKLYANSFLGSLNARAHIRATGTSSGRVYSSGTRGDGVSISTPRVPIVEITHQTITHDDHGDAMDSHGMDLKDLKGSQFP